MNTAGVPLYTKTIENVFDETLVSCFLGAIQSFAKGINQSCIDKIDMDKMTFFYAFKGSIYSVIVAETKDEVESQVYRVIAERLGRAFIQKYPPEVVNRAMVNTKAFTDFDAEYETITSEFSKMLHMSQKEFVYEYFVKAASNENILGMVIYDIVNDEFLARDIPKDIGSKAFESFSSMLFNFIDRLGTELKAGAINETLMRAKNYWIGAFRKGNFAVFTIFSQNFFGNILPDFVTRPLE